MTIGERIKQARKSKGITQKELAEKLGKSKSMIQKYEADSSEVPLSVLYTMEDILDVRLAERIGMPTPPDHTEARLNQLVEECGELISASARYRRHLHGDRTLNEKYTERKLIKDITEEMADVTLVASDVRRALGISEEELYKVINEKMKRTEELYEIQE